MTGRTEEIYIKNPASESLWVVNTLKSCFEHYGSELFLNDSVIYDNNWHEKADLIEFVYPVWGSAMPNPQRELLNDLPDSNGKKLFFSLIYR